MYGVGVWRVSKDPRNEANARGPVGMICKREPTVVSCNEVECSAGCLRGERSWRINGVCPSVCASVMSPVHIHRLSATTALHRLTALTALYRLTALTALHRLSASTALQRLTAATALHCFTAHTPLHRLTAPTPPYRPYRTTSSYHIYRTTTPYRHYHTTPSYWPYRTTLPYRPYPTTSPYCPYRITAAYCPTALQQLTVHYYFEYIFTLLCESSFRRLLLQHTPLLHSTTSMKIQVHKSADTKSVS